MTRLPGLLALLAAVALVGGCGGAGDTPPTPTTNAIASTSGGTTPQKTDQNGEGGQNPTKLTTPNRTIDPKQLVDVVKEEVQGGEKSEGPTPKDYLWQAPKTDPADGKAMTVKVPMGLPELIQNAQIPTYNPMTEEKFALGKQLYFEPRISKDGTVSCATCHNPEKGWTDQLPHSIGIHGQEGSRNAPTVLNTAYGRTMFWDGRAPSLEGQAQGPIQNKIEMGDQSYKEIVARLRAIKGYQEQFAKVFGTEVTLDGMAKAIAAFERSALSGNSAFDRYNGDGSRGVEPDPKALSDSQKRGMLLFGLTLGVDDEFKTDAVRGKARCTSCHVGFNFTDEQFHNIGVGWVEKERKFADLGRWAIAPIGAKNPAEIGAFKTPTVRDIEHTGPYMHDGSEKTLEDVVAYYDKGGNPNPYLDNDLKKLDLTSQEKADLVAFMKALTGEATKVELPTLPEGPDGKSPDPRAALTPPSSKSAMGGNPHALVR